MQDRMEALAQGAAANPYLRTLDLRNTGLLDVVAIGRLARMLASNPSLTELNLARNELGDAGCELLAEALETNAALSKVVLSGNKIGDIGCRRLAASLRKNTTVTKLLLDHNVITGAVATPIPFVHRAA
eukprot:SAG31_NODE_4201_length_3479_cov_1.626331_1_plen_129_part_00